jgi:NAD(P)-dependent dehydrogenase (short-subunit alcohol dehydrogenase family)
MAILVTGGAGYIGSHVAYELVDASRDVIVLDNLSTGFAGAVPSSARLVIGDIADEALLCKVHPEHGIDAIIHMAGSVVVPESITDPLGCYLNDTGDPGRSWRSRSRPASAVSSSRRRPRSTEHQRDPGRRGRAAAAGLSLRDIQDDDGADAGRHRESS